MLTVHQRAKLILTKWNKLWEMRLPMTFRGGCPILRFSRPFRSASGADEVGICILIEHQSTVDEEMVLRVDTYREPDLEFATADVDSEQRSRKSEAVVSRYPDCVVHRRAEMECPR